jgi:hypothetical protein
VDNNLPKLCRSTNLNQMKKVASYYMLNKLPQWMNGYGNPTKSGQVNRLIVKVRKHKVHGQGVTPTT